MAGGVNQMGGGTVNCLGVYKNDLYVGGAFETAGGIPAARIAKWDGVTWDSLSSGVWGIPKAIATYSGELYLGGGFLNAGGMASTSRIAKWNGSTWSSVAASVQTTTASIEVMAVYKGELYIGGNLSGIDGVSVNRIARWDGVSWKDVGGGVSGSIPSVKAMAVYNNELYVGGEFTLAGGISASRIAKWNGTQWDSVGTGFNGSVSNLIVDTVASILYAGGGFTDAGGELVFGLAQWNGSEWRRVDSILDSISGGGALGMYQDELHVGNGQPVASWNGESINYIGRWHGNQWRALGVGASQGLTTMTVFDGELYVGGAFDSAGGMAVNYIARWNMPDTTVSVPSVKKKEAHYLGNSIPNPAQGTVTIPYYMPSGTRGAIKLYGIQGALIREIEVNSGEEKIEMSLDGLSEGTYLYTLEMNGAVQQSKKMVVSQ